MWSKMPYQFNTNLSKAMSRKPIFKSSTPTTLLLLWTIAIDDNIVRYGN
jgi:hypothetical protein